MPELILSLIVIVAAFSAGWTFGLSWNRPIKAVNDDINDGVHPDLASYRDARK